MCVRCVCVFRLVRDFFFFFFVFISPLSKSRNHSSTLLWPSVFVDRTILLFFYIYTHVFPILFYLFFFLLVLKRAQKILENIFFVGFVGLHWKESTGAVQWYYWVVTGVHNNRNDYIKLRIPMDQHSHRLKIKDHTIPFDKRVSKKPTTTKIK